ncbi:MAG: carbohydrate ABC transporter permease [Rubrobacter sp.]|jgi:ABC-type sugar transport system permease subunit
MSQGRAEKLKKLPRAIVPGRGAFRQGSTALILLLPSLVVVFGIILYPLLRTLYISLFDVNSVFPGSYPFVGLGNYMEALGRTEFWAAILRTAYFTLSTTLLEVVLGILLGLLLNVEFRGRWLLRSIVILPWALPTVVNGAMWRWIFNPAYGALNALLTQLHIIPEYRSWLGTPWMALNMVVVADVWKMTPLAAFFILAALQTIPRELYEAAWVDGAGRLRAFFSITLPLLVPTIVIILVLRTMEAFKVFDIIYVMTRGGPADGTQTIAYYTYVEAFSNQLFGYGAALAYVIALFILFFAIIYMRLLRRGEVEY